MKQFIEILRPVNCIMTFLAVIIGALITGLPNLSPVIIAGASGFLICGGGMVINDYIDKDVDYINKPHRPIPSGRISPKIALIYSIILFITGFYFSTLINYLSSIVAFSAIALLIVYSKFFQRMFLIGNVIVSFLVGLSFVYGGLAAGRPFPPLILGAMAFLSNVSREIIKDVEDMPSDSFAKVNSVPIKLGKKQSKIFASTLTIAAILLSPLPYLLGMFGKYYISIVLIADFIFTYSIFMIIRNQKSKKIQKLMKIAMIIGLAAFLIGAF